MTRSAIFAAYSRRLAGHRYGPRQTEVLLRLMDQELACRRPARTHAGSGVVAVGMESGENPGRGVLGRTNCAVAGLSPFETRSVLIANTHTRPRNRMSQPGRSRGGGRLLKRPRVPWWRRILRR